MIFELETISASRKFSTDFIIYIYGSQTYCYHFNKNPIHENVYAVQIVYKFQNRKIPDARNSFQVDETNLVEHLTPSEWSHFVGPSAAGKCTFCDPVALQCYGRICTLQFRAAIVRIPNVTTIRDIIVRGERLENNEKNAGRGNRRNCTLAYRPIAVEIRTYKI